MHILKDIYQRRQKRIENMRNMGSQPKNTNVLWVYTNLTNETEIRYQGTTVKKTMTVGEIIMNLQVYNMSRNMLELVKYQLSVTNLQENTSQGSQPYCDMKLETFADGGDLTSIRWMKNLSPGSTRNKTVSSCILCGPSGLSKGIVVMNHPG
jgi:hypothetical protein